MSVKSYPTKAGPRWLYVIDLPKGPDGKRSQKMQRGFLTDKEAARAEADAKKTFGEQRLVADGTLAAELRSWLADRTIDAKPKTVGGYRTVLEAYVIPHIGARQVHALTAKTVNDLYRLLLDRGRRDGGPLSPASVKAVHKTLSSALHSIGVNLVGVRVPKVPRKRGRAGVWNDEQCVQFLQATRDDRLHAAWALAIVAGMRRGELAGLRWKHVDLTEGAISVVWQRTTVDGKGGGVVEGDPKSLDHIIPIGPDLVAILTRHQRRQEAERRWAASTWVGDGYVFCKPNGAPYYPGSITQAWRKRVAAVGLPHIALHDARHSSFSVSSTLPGVDLKTLQDRAGHTGPKMLTEIYLHAMPAGARAASLAIESHLLRGGPTQAAA